MSEVFRLTKFVTVGGIGVVLNTLCLFLFTDLLNIPYMSSAAAATVVVLVYRYLHNNYWSFGDRRRVGTQHVGTLSKFVAALILYHIVYFSTLYLLTDKVGLHYLVSSLLAITISLIPNYCLCWAWVWNKEIV